MTLFRNIFVLAFLSALLFPQSLPQNWDDFRRKDCEKKLLDKNHERADEYIITITGVIDGDSLCGEDEQGFQYRIRMDGIDAPEFRQSYYKQAKRSLAEKVLGKKVCLVIKEYDRYDRIIGRVYSAKSDNCVKE